MSSPIESNQTASQSNNRMTQTAQAGATARQVSTRLLAIVSPRFGGVEVLDDNKSAPWGEGALNDDLTRLA